MKRYNCCLVMLVLALFACFLQGNCQAPNANGQQPNSANQNSERNWSRDWRGLSGMFNGPSGGAKPKWFQIADRYMTKLTNNNAANGTNNQGGFFADLFDRISKQKKDKKKKKNKSKDAIVY